MFSGINYPEAHGPHDRGLFFYGKMLSHRPMDELENALGISKLHRRDDDATAVILGVLVAEIMRDGIERNVEVTVLHVGSHRQNDRMDTESNLGLTVCKGHTLIADRERDSPAIFAGRNAHSRQIGQSLRRQENALFEEGSKS